MRRVFVYEYLSGGGSLGHEAEVAALLPLGAAMRDAIVSDLHALPEFAVTCAVCARPGAGAAHDTLPTATARAGEDPVAFVQRQAAAHDLAWVVAPETDGLLLHEGHRVLAVTCGRGRRRVVRRAGSAAVPTRSASHRASTRRSRRWPRAACRTRCRSVRA